MKKLSLLSFIIIVALLTSVSSSAQGVWTVDKAHARLTFTITHLMVSDVEGTFKLFDASITAPKADFSDAVVSFNGDATSLDTENDQRDKHVKSADFLDVAKYPALTFKSTSFKKTGANTYTVAGNLTIHGVTKPVTLTATVRQGVNPQTKKEIAGFKIAGTINRSDFGVGPGFPGAVLSDEVMIAANAEFGKN